MTQASGWYDDPQDASQLRYWDGVSWSSHVTPKVSPTVEQSSIGLPYGVAPAAARPPGVGAYGAQGEPTAPGYGPPQPGMPPGPMPTYGQGTGWASNRPTTPDGVELSGWWKRVLASILDNIIVSIVSLPLTFVPTKNAINLLTDYFRQVMDAVNAGQATSPAVPAAFNTAILQISLIALAVHLVYEVLFVTRTGATPGKMALGISVRLRDRPGPPPLGAVLTRTAVKEGGNLVGGVPVIGLLGSVFALIDGLWPLWDPNKQAIHDKAGATNVVVGKQPRRTP